MTENPFTVRFRTRNIHRFSGNEGITQRGFHGLSIAH